MTNPFTRLRLPLVSLLGFFTINRRSILAIATLGLGLQHASAHGLWISRCG